MGGYGDLRWGIRVSMKLLLLLWVVDPWWVKSLKGFRFSVCPGSISKSCSLFSPSAVNIQAGAVTGMSSVFTGGVVVIALLFLTPLLYYLPQSVLAAIIMMAVVSLINVPGFVPIWQAQKYDGVPT